LIADEQKAIVSLLDRKTVQIDGLIAKKERMIELLQEERTAVINQAVTKGLDPKAEMKDSVIEWLGKIPKHWDITKLKYLCRKIGSGITPKGGATVYVLDGVPILRSQNIHFDGLKLDDVAYIPEGMHKELSATRVLQGDVLLNITGASIGRCHYWGKNAEANVNQHVCIIRPNSRVSTEYLHFNLSSEIGQRQIDSGQSGVSREGLNQEDLGNFIIPLCGVSEQRQIVGYLNKKTAQIDDQVNRAQKAIELLKEYRTALISEVVTGKIDVRGEPVCQK
jgi:type I restriction enzyme S subunit